MEDLAISGAPLSVLTEHGLDEALIEKLVNTHEERPPAMIHAAYLEWPTCQESHCRHQ